MITYFQSIILGLVQGVSELFPISSLGHSVILPSLLGWNIDQNASYFVIFLVATHLATSLVLFFFFFREWVLIFKGIIRSLKNRKINPADSYEKIGWLLVVATIPAGILGFLFQNKISMLFASPSVAAIFLFLNGLLLFGAESLRASKSKINKSNADTKDEKTIAAISWGQSIKIGFAQALALFPGFSRTGATLGAGLLVGLDHEDAARFSFLLATPIIFAAAALKLPELFKSGLDKNGPIIIGAVAAAIAAYISVRFLTNYFKTKTLKPFALYCCVAGILALVILHIR